MKLSVLIPIYCYDCRPLVEKLSEGLLACGIEGEVIVLDDGSGREFSEAQEDINLIPLCRYVHRDKNMGRAHTRNELAAMAQGELLMFIDADAMPIDASVFLCEYMRAANSNAIVYGGLCYPDILPPRGRRLRYVYGRAREQLSAVARQQSPYRHFNSICFLMPRQLFLSVGFDESFRAYGHEDTRFGLQLQERAIPIVHIDMPVLHLNDDDDREFMSKTREALLSLLEHADVLRDGNKMLHVSLVMRKYKLAWLPYLTYRLFGNLMEKHLCDRLRPSLKLYMLYKLCYILYQSE